MHEVDGRSTTRRPSTSTTPASRSRSCCSRTAWVPRSIETVAHVRSAAEAATRSSGPCSTTSGSPGDSPTTATVAHVTTVAYRAPSPRGGPSRPSPGAGWRGGHGWRRRDHRGSFEPMPRAFALALIALLGCPSATPRAPTAGGGVSGGPTGGGGGSGSGGPTRPPPDGGGGGDRDPTPPVRGATPTSCPAPSCVFHAGTVTGGTYQVCTASGAGACFHFGPRCAPADGCMFDPASQRYRACAQPSEGACASFGASCTPAGGCAFDPRDGQHRTCEQWSDGRCTRWGAACAP